MLMRVLLLLLLLMHMLMRRPRALFPLPLLVLLAGGRAGVRFTFADRLAALQLVERLHSIDVQQAIEVVDLVLEGLGQQAVGRAPELLAVPIARLDGDLLGALQPAPEARHRQAALVWLV